MSEKSFGQEMLEAFQEFHETIKTGIPLEEKYVVTVRRKATARNTRLASAEPPTPAQIVEARAALGASQAVFAHFLGVSPQAVRAWEQGTQKPSGIASRFIGEIRRDPAYWLRRLQELAVAVE